MPLIIDVKVIPRAKKNAFKLDAMEQLVCYLKSAPERGQANKELISLIAKAIGSPKNTITIIGGRTSRKKRLRIDKNISSEQLLAACGISLQLPLFDT